MSVAKARFCPLISHKVSALALSVAFAATPALGQEVIEGIVVTAQKREQAIDSVPMSITAISGEGLRDKGVSGTADLGKVVPGFVYQETALGNPVYTLRGVGYIDQSLAASPTVSVYLDQIPIPFSAMTSNVTLDLERVEVLKGPQGTLFGENSTGGAMNFIAAKPTDSFEAGLKGQYSRFNQLDVEGYLSGPLSDTLKARTAVKMLRGDEWQKSYTRNDENGKIKKYQGRLLLDWEPSEKTLVWLNINGWQDKSDTIAPQLVAVTPQVPAGVKPGVANYQVAPKKSRAADWTPGIDYARDDWYWQAALNIEHQLSDALSIISITSYQEYQTDAVYDNDGMSFRTGDRHNFGTVKAFNQELRAQGAYDQGNWVIGANYADYKTGQDFRYFLGDASNNDVAGMVFSEARGVSDNKIESKAAFANIEHNIIKNVSFLAGIRYTETERDAVSCGQDPGDGSVSNIFNFLSEIFRGGVPPENPALPGACYTLSADDLTPGPVAGSLDEKNTSWRLGLTWSPIERTMLYGTVSKGFKAGSIPAFSASSALSLEPIKEESLLAYEIGFKSRVTNRTQVNGALFYYDYKDKQLYGLLTDPIFGVIQQLVSIPKAKVQGAELQVQWQPISGLSVNASGTYLDTEIKQFIGVSASGLDADFKGEKFPFAPKWQFSADIEYNWPISSDLNAFAGVNGNYQDSTSASIGDADLFHIKSYGTVDIRAGVSSADERWKFSVWGRNISGEYYWTQVERQQDSTLRYVGKPRTYGVSFAYRFN